MAEPSCREVDVGISQVLEDEGIEVRLQFPEEADAALSSAKMMTRG